MKMKFPAEAGGPIVASGPLVKRFELALGRSSAHQLLKRLGKLVQSLPSAKAVCVAEENCVLEAFEKIPVRRVDADLFALDFGNDAMEMQLQLPALNSSGAKWSLIWWNIGEKDPIKEQILLFPSDCGR